MKLYAYRLTSLVLPFAALLLAACSPGPSEESQVAADDGAAPAKIEAPTGRYGVDRNHANLSFSINHVGLSNYIARFTDYDVTLELDPDNLADSSVAVTIDA